MSGFDLSWLDLREPADHAGRDKALLRAAAGYLDARVDPLVVDLGCGSGSTARALGPALSRPVRWRLVDHDPALLTAAAARTGGEAVRADLVDTAALPLDGADLVTASALLDLVSGSWLRALCDRLKSSGSGLYAALSYDGDMRWIAAHDADDAVLAAFNAHQRTDKGFGSALGPDAGEAAARELERRGFKIAVASSPWMLGADDAGLESALVGGVAEAALETGRITPAEAESWRRFRLQRVGEGCLIGHRDILALP